MTTFLLLIWLTIAAGAFFNMSICSGRLTFSNAANALLWPAYLIGLLIIIMLTNRKDA